MDTHAHKPNYKLYYAIFGALMLGTVLTVAVSYVHLPRFWALFVGLLIASVKASLVVAFFMHLKGERAIIYGLLAVTAFCLIGFILIPLDTELLEDRTTHTAVTVPHGQSHAEPAGEAH